MIRLLKNIINNNITLRKLIIPIYKYLFFESEVYWEKRYKTGGDSGSGAYGRLAKFKSNQINDFLEKNKINDIVELGCGDGANLKLYNFKNYTGFDVSKTIIKSNKKRFKKKNYQFDLIKNLDESKKYDLALSLDVLYHLTEEKIFEKYLNSLFNISSKYVIIYSSNFESFDYLNAHVRHRKFENKVPKSFELIDHIPNIFKSKAIHDQSGENSVCDFFIYKRIINT